MKVLIIDLMYGISPVDKVTKYLGNRKVTEPIEILVPIVSNNITMLEKIVRDGHAKSIMAFGTRECNPFEATSRGIVVADEVLILIDNTVQAEMLGELVMLCQKNKKDFDIL